MARILCLGNVSADLTLVPQSGSLRINGKDLLIPRGAKLDADQLHFSIGGSASNLAHSMINFGHQGKIYSQVGDDTYGDGIIRELKKKKLFGNIVRIKKTQSVVSTIINYNGDRTIFTSSYDLAYDKWAEDGFDGFDWIALGPIHGEATILYQKIIDAVIKNKTRLALIPSNYQLKNDIDNLKRLLRITDIYISNFEEATALVHNVTGTDLKRLCATIAQYGPQIVSITRGAQGAFAFCNDIFVTRPAFENPNVVDTTGAGDAFSAGFISVLAKSSIWNEQLLLAGLEMGLQNSSSILSEYGANNGIMTPTEISKSLNKLVEIID